MHPGNWQIAGMCRGIGALNNIKVWNAATGEMRKAPSPKDVQATLLQLVYVPETSEVN